VCQRLQLSNGQRRPPSPNSRISRALPCSKSGEFWRVAYQALATNCSSPAWCSDLGPEPFSNESVYHIFEGHGKSQQMLAADTAPKEGPGFFKTGPAGERRSLRSSEVCLTPPVSASAVQKFPSIRSPWTTRHSDGGGQRSSKVEKLAGGLVFTRPSSCHQQGGRG
jgi:hypothetical protein